MALQWELSEDLRAWLLACEDFFNWNPREWGDQRECIKFPIGRLKENTRAHEFGVGYRRSMEGHDGRQRIRVFQNWGKSRQRYWNDSSPRKGRGYRNKRLTTSNTRETSLTMSKGSEHSIIELECKESFFDQRYWLQCQQQYASKIYTHQKPTMTMTG